MEYQKKSLKHSGSYGIQTHDLHDKIFPSLAIGNMKRQSLTNSGFDGIQTHEKIFSSFQNSKEERL